MSANSEKYIPALKYHRLTVLYDTLLRLTMQESAFKMALVRQAHIEPGQQVLDLGCGTATLSLFIKSTHPVTNVVGLDADPKALALAHNKILRAGVEVSLDEGFSYALPYPDHSFDRVLSSLLFHHLNRDHKEMTLQEVRRVLKPDGQLHIADWGKAQNRLTRVCFYLVQTLDGFEATSDNVKGLLPALIQKAGFVGVMEERKFMTLFGTLALYSACIS